MTAVPRWAARPPRAEGWLADDLDHIPDEPRHTEVIDGALVFRSPQTLWHSRVTSSLANALMAQAPAGVAVMIGMTVRLDERNRPEPDLLATTAPYEPDCTFFTPGQVPLVVEVVAPKTAQRDRTVKPRKYAEAGIAHYWRVETEDAAPVVHAYDIDRQQRSYAPTGIYRRELRATAPFPIRIDLDELLRQIRTGP